MKLEWARVSWKSTAGLVGTVGLFGVRLSPPRLSLLLRCRVGSLESQACALTSPMTFITLHLHWRCQSQRYFSWIQAGAFPPAKGQSSPALFTTGLLKVKVKNPLVGILKHCCRAKMGAACLIRSSAHHGVFSIVNGEVGAWEARSSGEGILTFIKWKLNESLQDCKH